MTEAGAVLQNLLGELTRESSKTTSKIEPGPVPLFDPAKNSDENELMKPELYNCPECLNHGVLLTRDEKGALWGRPCRCMAIRRNIWRLDKSGLRDMIDRFTFDSYKTLEPWQEKAKQMAMEYAEKPEGWFLAAGSVGAGKTHLCTAICGALLRRGEDVRYMLWRDVATEAKSLVNDREAYQAIIEPLKRVDFLYIDDLFKMGKHLNRNGELADTPPTTGDINFAFELLNFRNNDKSKHTIISTELSMEALTGIDPALGSRIYENARGHRLVLDGKENWRLKG